MISPEDYLWFVDRTLDRMNAILRELGDGPANERPDLEGANSPVGIVRHCVGVTRSWAGYLVAGHDVERDRETEFVAREPVETLIAKVDQAKSDVRADVASAEFAAPLRNAPGAADADLPYGLRQGAALMHLYEELAQHFGQLEITRDYLLAGRG